MKTSIKIKFCCFICNKCLNRPKQLSSYFKLSRLRISISGLKFLKRSKWCNWLQISISNIKDFSINSKIVKILCLLKKALEKIMSKHRQTISVTSLWRFNIFILSFFVFTFSSSQESLKVGKKILPGSTLIMLQNSK